MPSSEALFTAIDRYRRKQSVESTRPDSNIGCIILQSPFFLDQSDWIPVPADYHSNLVQGKRFSLGSATGQHLLSWATSRLRLPAVREGVATVPGPTFGDLSLIRCRLGQGAIRVLVADAYDRRCAVTGEKALPVLEAAHIVPVGRGGEHRVDNGLPLRSDLHKFFDLGYVTVTPAGDFRVSSKLRDTWMNGKIYYALDKQTIRQPSNATSQPSQQSLQWHNDTVFRP